MNSFKPASEEELGKVREQISPEVTKKISATEQKITTLNEELVKQSKATTDNSSTLHDLMVSIENLSSDVVKMNSELSYWKETEIMEVEDELVDLDNPISLPKLAKIMPKAIDLLSTNSDTWPHQKAHPKIFLIDELGVMPPSSRANLN